MLHIVRILMAVQLLAGVPVLRATEKHWLAHQAQFIVVGTFNPKPTLPWFDGWHMGGVIDVDEVLYGQVSTGRINFRLFCAWKSMCVWWPPPQFPEFTLKKGLWFLQRLDRDTWESPLGLWDFGFRPLSDRAYWANYIRLYKR
jgi:hypothetical protein